MSTAIAHRQQSQSLIQVSPPTDLDGVIRLGELLCRSGFFQDAKEAGQAVTKILAGQEMGFPPIASMTGVYIVKGKVSLSANLIAAAIKRSGRYTFRCAQGHPTSEECEITFFERASDGWNSIGTSSFTIAEAHAANLHKEWDKQANAWKEKATWKNFPKNMLFARALSNGAKWFCPDIFGGPVYTPDELDAPTNEHGELIESPNANLRIVKNPQSAIRDPQSVEEYASKETITAILSLWPEHGPKITRTETTIPLAQWLRDKRGCELDTWPAEGAQKTLEWLQGRDLAKRAAEEPAIQAAAQADKGSGLDQWVCTRETGNRSLAMAVLAACERIEKTGVTPDQWREELSVVVTGEGGSSVSRKDLTAAQAQEFVGLLNQWAESKERKAA